MISNIVSSVTSIIDKIIPDPKQAAEAKLKLFALQQSGELSFVESAASVIRQEATGESWLQRNWRPLTMAVFLVIIINNYIIAPYFSAFGLHIPCVPRGDKIWTIMEIGIGGYIPFRSGEKMIKYWRDKN